MIGDVTGSKWFVMKPNKIYKTSNFVEYEGRWYSNKNHLNAYNLYKVYDYYYDDVYDYNSSYDRKYRDYDYCDEFDDYDYWNYSYSKTNTRERILDKADELFSKTMIKKIKKVSNGEVWEDIQEFIKDFCLDKYTKCMYCDTCFGDLTTKNEIIDKLEECYGLEYDR